MELEVAHLLQSVAAGDLTECSVRVLLAAEREHEFLGGVVDVGGIAEEYCGFLIDLSTCEEQSWRETMTLFLLVQVDALVL